MLLFSELFEAATPANYAPPAQGVMSSARDYVLNRIAVIKANFARGRMKTPEYAQQMAELRKNLRNPQMGVTQF